MSILSEQKEYIYNKIDELEEIATKQWWEQYIPTFIIDYKMTSN